MTDPGIIWRAAAATRHFQFEGYGESSIAARQALAEAFQEHCDQYPDADRSHFQEIVRDMEPRPFIIGRPYRDGEAFPRCVTWAPGVAVADGDLVEHKGGAWRVRDARAAMARFVPPGDDRWGTRRPYTLEPPRIQGQDPPAEDPRPSTTTTETET